MLFPSKENEKKLVSVLGSAKKSVRMIVKNLSNKKIETALKGLLDKRVTLQIIIESRKSGKAFSAPLARLKDAGAQIRVSSDSESEIQTKFALVDSFLALNGAMNFGEKDLSRLYDNMIVTTEEKVVKNLDNEFEFHWENGNQLEDSYVDRDNESVASENLGHEIGGNGHTRERSREKERQKDQSEMLFGMFDPSMLDPDNMKETINSYIGPVTSMLDKADQVRQLDEQLKGLTGQGVLPENMADLFKKVKDTRDSFGM